MLNKVIHIVNIHSILILMSIHRCWTRVYNEGTEWTLVLLQLLTIIVFLLGTYAIMAFKQEITLEEHHDSYPGDGNSVN